MLTIRVWPDQSGSFTQIVLQCSHSCCLSMLWGRHGGSHRHSCQLKNLSKWFNDIQYVLLVTFSIFNCIQTYRRSFPILVQLLDCNSFHHLASRLILSHSVPFQACLSAAQLSLISADAISLATAEPHYREQLRVGASKAVAPAQWALTFPALEKCYQKKRTSTLFAVH